MALSTDRILQLERGIVASMEREVRAMVESKKREQKLEEHRTATERKWQDLEARRQRELGDMAHAHAAKAAKHQEIRQRVLQNLEIEKEVAAATQRHKQYQAMERQARMVAEQKQKAEFQKERREAKSEYLKHVQAQLRVVQEHRKNEILANFVAHEEQCANIMKEKEFQMQETARLRALKEQHNLQKREDHKLCLEAQKIVTKERLRTKHAQAEQVKIDQKNELKVLHKLKEDFADKKRDIQNIIAEAGRTGNMKEAEEELARLKEQQLDTIARANEARKQGSPSLMSPLALGQRPRSAQSARFPSPATAGYFPREPSPLSARGYPSSAPRWRCISVPQSPYEMVAFGPAPTDPDVPAPGSHYAHLMSLFKARQHSAR